MKSTVVTLLGALFVLLSLASSSQAAAVQRRVLSPDEVDTDELRAGAQPPSVFLTS
ncbi:1,3-beta-glucansynthase [Moniliophthora roreri]|uniref:Secreted protein n=1 Tax=Moniliophthora roreri TaxID=221103 RepID=A0A0W0G8P5_MONRR|nr:1,3-beta-glucansynthase [Moniliophthora roreri]